MTDNTQPALSPGTYTIKIQNTIQAVESHSEPTPIITSPSPLDLPPNDPDRDGDGDGLSRLCENFGVLRLPESQLVESTDESAQWLNDKLRNGYALVKTRDQTGAATMAVCRGPLIPFPGQESSAVRGKDLAIIDERTGIRDISYQVTWQLGREVLMKDHSLVISLVRLKRKIFEEVKKRVAACSGTEDHELVMREITSVIKECFGFDNTPPDDDATAIQRFISEAHQTSNITQSHLITDPDMLPLESIRTFYTDQSWIEAFLDGGLSNGNHSGVDESINQAIKTGIQDCMRERLRDQIPRWGFLLRTEAITELSGLKVDTTESNKILSKQLLSTNDHTILLVLFTNPPTPNTTLVLSHPRHTTANFFLL